MALADWMIPKPSLAAQAQLQHSLQVLRRDGRAQIDSTIELTAQLLQQNMHYRTLLKQAVGHIAELELREFLQSSAPALPAPRSLAGQCAVESDCESARSAAEPAGD